MTIAVSYMATRADMARVWLALLLTAITIVLFGWYDRYEQAGADLIASGFSDPGWFARDPRRIERVADGVVLRNDDSSATVAMDYTLARPAGGRRLRLEVEARYRDVVRGRQPFANARVLLLQRDASGRELWHHPHDLLNASGSSGWQHLRGTYLLAHDTSSLRLTVALNRAAGTLSVRDIRLYPVQEAVAASVARGILLAVWAAFLIWVT